MERAVNAMPIEKIVSIKFDLGLDQETQKTKTKTKSYSSIKYTAIHQDVFDVANALVSLQTHDLLSIVENLKTELAL